MINFEVLAEQCLMERTNEVEAAWSQIVHLDTVWDVMRHAAEMFGEEYGYGLFSNVFKSPSGNDFVLKVSYEDGDGWVPFAEIVSQQQKYKTNPLFPIIPSHLFKKFPDGSAMAIIEWVKLDEEYTERQIEKIIEDVYLEYPDHIMGMDAGDNPFNCAFEELLRNKEPVFVPPICNAFGTTSEHLYDYFEVVRLATGSTNMHMIDLNEQNIGYRSNGQTVLFDPVGFYRHEL